MMILRFLLLCMMTASAFAASSGDVPFEGHLSLTREVGGHKYDVVKFDPANEFHGRAALELRAEPSDESGVLLCSKYAS